MAASESEDHRQNNKDIWVYRQEGNQRLVVYSLQVNKL